MDNFKRWLVENESDVALQHGGVINDLDKQIQQEIQKAAAAGDYEQAKKLRDYLLLRQRAAANRGTARANAPTIAQQAPAPAPARRPSITPKDQQAIGPWSPEHGELQKALQQFRQPQRKKWFGIF
jgi:hypothetical protein